MSHIKILLLVFMMECYVYLMAKFFFGAVITRTPSEDRLETTSSALASGGRVYLLENILDTILLPSSAFSSCFPSTVTTPLSTLTSILLSSSFTLISSLSFVLNKSKPVVISGLRPGNIQRRGNIHPFSYLVFESCLIRSLFSLVDFSEIP